MHTYRTSLPRVLLGIVAGALTGGLLFALAALRNVIRDRSLHGYELVNALAPGLFVAVVWLVGLVLFASIPWAILHRAGLRSWRVAVAFGLVLTFIVTLALLTSGFGLFAPENLTAADSGGPTWSNGRLTAHGWAGALKPALLNGAAGALVGLVVWAIAYRRA